jgi:hypothetical protein
MITSSACTSCSCLGNERVHLSNGRALLHARCILVFLYSQSIESRETRGSVGALLSREAGSGAAGCVATPSPPYQVGGVLHRRTRGSTGALPCSEIGIRVAGRVGARWYASVPSLQGTDSLQPPRHWSSVKSSPWSLVVSQVYLHVPDPPRVHQGGGGMSRSRPS